MSEVVLDASALLALLNRKPGHEEIARIITHAAISAVNLSETAAKLAESGMPGEEIRDTLEGLAPKIHDFGRELAFQTGLLRPLTRSRGLSLGDRACLALGQQLNLPVLTTDRAWEGLVLGVEKIFPARGIPRAPVKQYAHYSSRSQRTSRRVFEHGANLLQLDARKPLHEPGNLRAVLKVLEQRGNGHARAAKRPGSAAPLGVPFDGGATRPINHETNRSTATLGRLTTRVASLASHSAGSSSSRRPARRNATRSSGRAGTFLSTSGGLTRVCSRRPLRARRHCLALGQMRGEPAKPNLSVSNTI